MDLLQWGIPIIVGILTFFAGRGIERQRQAQANRLALLEPIEDWIDQMSRIIGIVGDELSSATEGLPTGYSPEERLETLKKLREQKAKVLGILKSKALKTPGTKRQANKLENLVTKLDEILDREYFKEYGELINKLKTKDDARLEFIALLGVTARINSILQDTHGLLAELKTAFS